MVSWDELNNLEREEYVNQDYVPRKYILVDTDTFENNCVIASECSERHIDEHLVQDMLNYLTDKQKKVITLYYIEGWTHKRIADLFGISESAVRSRIQWARKRLREYVTYFLNKQ
jgi:RNA polymerase sigma factor (sigma-70 family)